MCFFFLFLRLRRTKGHSFVAAGVVYLGCRPSSYTCTSPLLRLVAVVVGELVLSAPFSFYKLKKWTIECFLFPCRTNPHTLSNNVIVVPPGGIPLITVITRVKGRNGEGKHLQETCHATKLDDICLPQDGPTVIKSDNTTAIGLAQDTVKPKRSAHTIPHWV